MNSAYNRDCSAYSTSAIGSHAAMTLAVSTILSLLFPSMFTSTRLNHPFQLFQRNCLASSVLRRRVPRFEPCAHGRILFHFPHEILLKPLRLLGHSHCHASWLFVDKKTNEPPSIFILSQGGVACNALSSQTKKAPRWVPLFTLFLALLRQRLLPLTF